MSTLLRAMVLCATVGTSAFPWGGWGSMSGWGTSSSFSGTTMQSTTKQSVSTPASYWHKIDDHIAQERYEFLTHARNTLNNYQAFVNSVNDFLARKNNYAAASTQQEIKAFIGQYAGYLNDFAKEYKNVSTVPPQHTVRVPSPFEALLNDPSNYMCSTIDALSRFVSHCLYQQAEPFLEHALSTALTTTQIRELKTSCDSYIDIVNGAIESVSYLTDTQKALLQKKANASIGGYAGHIIIPLYSQIILNFSLHNPQLTTAQAATVVNEYDNVIRWLKRYSEIFYGAPGKVYTDNGTLEAKLRPALLQAYDTQVAAKTSGLDASDSLPSLIVIAKTISHDLSVLATLSQAAGNGIEARTYQQRHHQLESAIDTYERLQGMSINSAMVKRYVAAYNDFSAAGLEVVGTALLSWLFDALRMQGMQELTKIEDKYSTTIAQIHAGKVVSDSDIKALAQALEPICSQVARQYEAARTINVPLGPTLQNRQSALNNAQQILSELADACAALVTVVDALQPHASGIASAYSASTGLLGSFNTVAGGFHSESQLSSYIPASLLWGNSIAPECKALIGAMHRRLGSVKHMLSVAQAKQNDLDQTNWQSPARAGVYGSPASQSWFPILSLYVAAVQTGYAPAVAAMSSAFERFAHLFENNASWTVETNIISHQKTVSSLLKALGLYGIYFYDYLGFAHGGDASVVKATVGSYARTFFSLLRTLLSQIKSERDAHHYTQALDRIRVLRVIDNAVQQFVLNQHALMQNDNNPGIGANAVFKRTVSQSTVTYSIEGCTQSVSFKLPFDQQVEIASAGAQYYVQHKEYETAYPLYETVVHWYDRKGNTQAAEKANSNYQKYQSYAVARAFADNILVASTASLPFNFGGKSEVLKNVPVAYYAKSVSYKYPANQPVPSVVSSGGSESQVIEALLGMLVTALQDTYNMAGSDAQRYINNLKTRVISGVAIDGKTYKSTVTYDAPTQTIIETYVPIPAQEPTYSGQQTVLSTYYTAYKIFNASPKQRVSIGTKTYVGLDNHAQAQKLARNMALSYLSIAYNNYVTLQRHLADTPSTQQRAHTSFAVSNWIDKYNHLNAVFNHVYRSAYYAKDYYAQHTSDTSQIDLLNKFIPALYVQLGDWCMHCLGGNPYGVHNRHPYNAMFGYAYRGYAYAGYFYNQLGVAGNAIYQDIQKTQIAALYLDTATRITQYTVPEYENWGFTFAKNYWGAIGYYQQAMNWMAGTKKKSVVELLSVGSQSARVQSAAYKTVRAYFYGVAQAVSLYSKAVHQGVRVAGALHTTAQLKSQYKQWNGGDYTISNVAVATYNQVKALLLNAMIYSSTVQTWLFQLSGLQAKKSTSTGGKQISWPGTIGLPCTIMPLEKAYKNAGLFLSSPTTSEAITFVDIARDVLHTLCPSVKTGDKSVRLLRTPTVLADKTSYQSTGEFIEDIYSMMARWYIKQYIPSTESTKDTWQALENAMRAQADNLTAPPTAYV